MKEKFIRNRDYGMLLFYFGVNAYVDLYNRYKSEGKSTAVNEMKKVAKSHQKALIIGLE